MKPADIASARIPGRPAVNPRGDTVVVALSQIDLDADDYTSQLWISPADGSAPPRKLTGGWRDGAAEYSPDGAWVGFIRTVRGDDGKTGKPQLYVLPTAGGDARRVAMCRFFAETIATGAEGLEAAVLAGADALEPAPLALAS